MNITYYKGIYQLLSTKCSEFHNQGEIFSAKLKSLQGTEGSSADTQCLFYSCKL